jgi:hypothetical protein
MVVGGKLAQSLQQNCKFLFLCAYVVCFYHKYYAMNMYDGIHALLGWSSMKQGNIPYISSNKCVYIFNTCAIK